MVIGRWAVFEIDRNIRTGQISVSSVIEDTGRKWCKSIRTGPQGLNDSRYYTKGFFVWVMTYSVK